MDLLQCKRAERMRTWDERTCKKLFFPANRITKPFSGCLWGGKRWERVHFGAWFKMRKPTDFRPVFVFLGVLCGGAKMALQRLCKTGHAARRVFLKNRAKTATQSHFLHFAMLLKSALQHNKASRSRDGILPLFGAANFYFNRTFASD